MYEKCVYIYSLLYRDAHCIGFLLHRILSRIVGQTIKVPYTGVTLCQYDFCYKFRKTRKKQI